MKSRRCESHACLEAAVVGDGILVRNSVDPEGTLMFTREEWVAFVGGVRDGDFDFGLVPQSATTP